MDRRTIMIALSLAICGCWRPYAETTFTPYASSGAPAVTSRAIVVSPGDVDTLWRAGGVVLGYIYVEGRPYLIDIDEEAQKKAVENGGTHIVLRTMQRAPSSEPAPKGWVPNPPLAAPYDSPDGVGLAGYDVVRVPPERWGELPPLLRPGVLSTGKR